jgi:hypothetical protein
MDFRPYLSISVLYHIPPICYYLILPLLYVSCHEG